MLCSRLIFAGLILLAFGTASAQPELVVANPDTKQYHRPSCALVRNGANVVAMNVGQAEARGYKSHPQCDPANVANDPAQPAPGRASSDEPQPTVYVYTAAGDARYHRETCAKLAKEHRKVALEQAGKKLWPCSECRPPIRKRTPIVKRYGRE
jgi:hypothetical protein